MAGRVNVVLDRAVYYDNDTIVGEFILLPFEDTEIVNIAVELQCVCSFTHHKAGGEAKVVTIIYEKSTTLANKYYARGNEKLVYNFGFQMPDNCPPTMAYYREKKTGIFGSYCGNVHWQVSVRADTKTVETLVLRKRFLKGTFYRLPPEMKNVGSEGYVDLYLEGLVSLTANIDQLLYRKGEPIKVHIAVSNNAGWPVTEIQCACVLHMGHSFAKKMMGTNVRDIYLSEAIIHKDLPLRTGGALETDLSVVPMNTQVVRHSSVGIEPEEWERHRIQHNSELLVPSFSNPEDPEAKRIYMTYLVRVSVLMRKGIKLQKMTLDLPFILSGNPPDDDYVPDTLFITPHVSLLGAKSSGTQGTPGTPNPLRKKSNLTRSLSTLSLYREQYGD